MTDDCEVANRLSRFLDKIFLNILYVTRLQVVKLNMNAQIDRSQRKHSKDKDKNA